MNLTIMNLKLFSGIATVTALSVLTYSLIAPNQEASSQGYIMQGASQSAMAAQVEAVGGKVTRHFNTINAVSAALTPSQMAQVSAANPMLRLFADTEVSLNAKPAIETSTNITGQKLVNEGWDSGRNLVFNLTGNFIEWKAKNRTGSGANIQAVDVSWPEKNGELREISIDGKVFSGNNKGYLSIELDENQRVSIKDNGNLEIRMDFEKVASLMEDDYSIKVITAEGGKLAMVPYEQELSSPAPIRYALDSNKLEWKTLSRSLVERKLSQVTIDWPVDNGQLTTFKINGKNVLEYPIVGGQAAMDVIEDIVAKPEEQIEVELEFDRIESVADNEYKVFLAFSDGSRKTFSSSKSTPQQGDDRDTFFPTIVRANEAHSMGILGDGVTVAIIDSGMQGFKKLTKNNRDVDRIKHVYNVLDSNNTDNVEDSNGHGTHIASIIANNSQTFTLAGETTDSYNSIAPSADLVIVRAFDENGQASYADILSAIEYVIDNREALDIKVLNLSFSATPSSNYWEDPINQALMVAWQSGITVVAAAGNQGPDAMTIGVPGNNPYIITVGAVSDNYTPDSIFDDFVTEFSSAGPTFEGFVKPELVAPGGHIQGLMGDHSMIGNKYKMYDDGSDYFLLSGSSQSTAITSGIVALMLQDSPTLSPDDIKCRLLDTARAAVTDNGQLAFSIFQQGAGMVDAMSALNSNAVGCGNAGMDIAKDIAGVHHYIGPAQRFENNGDFYIPDQQGLEWNGLYSDGHLWGNVRFFSDGHLWGNVRFNSDGHLWGNVRFVSDGHLWGNVAFNTDGHLWGNVRFKGESDLTTDTIQTKWVDQE